MNNDVGNSAMNRDAAVVEKKSSCPYCQGHATHFISSSDRNRRTTRAVFDYYRCQQCGLIFMDPLPNDLAPFYKGGYDPIPSTASELKLIAAKEKFRTEPILKYRSQGSCLEIGPWRGVICSNMKDAGFNVTAIEMNSECVHFLRKELGVEAIQSSDPAETMMSMKPGFDVIIAWHSLEHLPCAWRVIERAAQLLVPGGVLLLAMPNPESYEFAVLKSAWMHLDTPRHLYLFPLSTLIQICEKNHLRPVEITTADEFSKIQSRHAWHNLPRSWVPTRYIRGVLALTIGNLLYSLAYKRQMTEGLGSAYTAVFVRE
jgi:2-polyprenyl-3-methyl-5-hydroxy-6-metoxy-1,4-benzoquinol methylase